MCCLDAIRISVHGFVLFVVQSGKTWFSFSPFDIFNKKKIDVHLKKGKDKEDEGEFWSRRKIEMEETYILKKM